MSHTPGPWEVNDRWYIGKPDTGTFAEVMCCRGVKAEDEAQHEANARLIAAAPDLLQVLESIRDEMEDYYDGAPDSPTLWMGLHIKRATEAIAKAEGVR
jgi:hypothetical protein